MGSRDHPRLRGEHNILEYDSFFERGSPPPTRGTLFNFIKFLLFSGITPAYAGNTGTIKIEDIKHGDHPRLRGEHI